MRCIVHSVRLLPEIFSFFKNISKKIFALLIISHFCLTFSVNGTAMDLLKIGREGSYGNEKFLIDLRHGHKAMQAIARPGVPDETKQTGKEPALPRQEEKQKSKLGNIFTVVLFLMVIIALLGLSRQRILIRKKKTELKNCLLHEKQMALDLQASNMQLATYTLSLAQKNDLLKDVLEQVNHARQHSTNGLSKEFHSLRHLLEHHLNHENDWNDFRLYFEKVHNGFFNTLKQKHPCLTSNDLRICALLRLNMNIKEMAALLAISPDSAKMARYRLRQKLNLQKAEDLAGYMISMDHNT